MNAWNDTKAINFKQVTDYHQANIIVNAGNYSNTGWAGITQLPAVPRGYLYGSIISYTIQQCDIDAVKVLYNEK